MKILSLAQVDMSQADARVVHIFGLAKAFNQNKAKTDIVIISPKPSAIKQENLKVYLLPGALAWWLIEGIICNIFTWFIIFTKNKSYDKIYVRYHSNLALALKFAFIKRPIWLEVNGLFKDEELFKPKSFSSRLKSAVGSLLEKMAFRKANHIFCVTPELKDRIIELYKINTDKVTAVSNGVDTEEYKPLSKKESCQLLGLDEDKIYIGFIGRFVGWSGIDTFLKSLPPVLKEYKNVKAIIVGDGEYYSKYRKLADSLGISDKIIFPGQSHKEMAPVWINCFSIGISLTKPKGHGLSPVKLYSYMSCGVPVLGSDLPGFDPVKDWNSGFLVKYDDLVSVQKYLCQLLDDEKLREALGRNGRKCAEKLFSWKVVAKKIIST